ncbi:hypothetical protein J7L48_03880 [bacterium]|nr:hypothetical protein [bacterium]
MKKSVTLFFLIILFVFSANVFSDTTEAKSAVAVIDLQAKKGVSADVASMLSDYLRSKLLNTNKYIMVTRENMNLILKEQDFQRSGCTSQECIVQIGKMLGVSKIFTGSLGMIGSVYVLNIKMLNIETGQIEKAESDQAKSEEDLLASVEKIVAKISGKIYVPQYTKTEQGSANTQLKPKNFIENRKGHYYMNRVQMSSKELDNILRLNPLTKELMIKQSKRTKLGSFVFLPIAIVSLGFLIPNLAKALDDTSPGDEYYIPDDEKSKAKRVAIVSGIIYMVSGVTAGMLIGYGKSVTVDKAVKIYNKSLSLREKDGVLIFSFTRKF